MLTLTGQYALRAMLEIAQAGEGRRMTSQEIATRAQIPPKYLSVILRGLAQAGILDSVRGAGGGFRLRRDARDVTLFAVVRPFEPRFSTNRACPFGNRECDDAHPCAVHHEYKTVVEYERRFLEARNLADVSARLATG